MMIPIAGTALVVVLAGVQFFSQIINGGLGFFSFVWLALPLLVKLVLPLSFKWVDIILLGTLAVLLPNLTAAMFLAGAFLSFGILGAIYLKMRKLPLSQPLPFVPFITLSFILSSALGGMQ